MPQLIQVQLPLNIRKQLFNAAFSQARKLFEAINLAKAALTVCEAEIVHLPPASLLDTLKERLLRIDPDLTKETSKKSKSLAQELSETERLYNKVFTNCLQHLQELCKQEPNCPEIEEFCGYYNLYVDELLMVGSDAAYDALYNLSVEFKKLAAQYKSIIFFAQLRNTRLEPALDEYFAKKEIKESRKSLHSEIERRRKLIINSDIESKEEEDELVKPSVFIDALKITIPSQSVS